MSEENVNNKLGEKAAKKIQLGKTLAAKRFSVIAISKYCAF